MRRIVRTAINALAIAGLVVAPAASARERLTGEEKLAKLLEGRTAGEARNCLNTFATRHMQIIDRTAIVIRDGRTVWVNVPRNAEDLDDDDILVIKQFGSQLCRQDNVTTRDRAGFFFSGVVFLGDFVPYRKTAG